MIKRFFLAILTAMLSLTPATVQSQTLEKISLVESKAEIQFPNSLVFKIRAQSQSDITKIRLHYRVDKMSLARVTNETWPEVKPSTKIDTEWKWDMRKAALPAGSKVHYWWTIEDAGGNRLTTPTETVHFDDLRYSWQKLTSGQLTLLWYNRDKLFAEDLMNGAQEAVKRLAEDTGVRLLNPVTIYIYANSEDLQGAMIFPREWTGGVAYPEYRTIAIGITSRQLTWGIRALAHELGHLVTDEMTYSPYGASLPTWIDEGLAMHAEGKPDADMELILEKGISRNQLISVRSLSSPFSAVAKTAYLSYAQSQSIIDYLLQAYGKEKMLSLLSLFKEGNTCDEALTKVYGFDQDGLDRLWQEYVKKQSKSESLIPPKGTTESKVNY